MLLGCGSVCISLSPLASWLWLCPSAETLCGRLHLPGCLACTSNTTARQCALRDRWLAVGARARWSCSLQQRVLLTMRTDLSFWSFGRFVAAAVRRWFPTPLRHCVILWAVSTLITKANIPASCHGVVRRFVRHRWRVIDPRVSLSSGFFLWSCHCHTLLPFTCAHGLSLLSSSPASQCLSLRSAAIARLVLDAPLLHCKRAARPTLLNCAVQSFYWMRNSVFSFLLLVAELGLSAECGLLFRAPSIFPCDASSFC